MMLPLAGIAYVSWHIWVLLPLAWGWKTAIISAGVLSFLTLFLDFTGSLDKFPLPVAQVLYAIGTSSVIVLLYAVMLFLIVDLGRLVRIVPKTWVYDNWTMAICLFGLLTTVLIYGNIHYNNKVRVPISLKSSKPLPREYKVVMLSDLHLGYHNPRPELARWVDMVNAEQPDVVLIAGDIIDISVHPLIEENMAAEFRRLNAPVYACLGNHEYYSGSPAAQQFYKDAGIQLLSDSAAVFDNAITIIGRDDRTNVGRKSIEALMSAADKSNYTIVLDHQPYHLERSEHAGVDFQLSGHTHRGQVWPLNWITDAMYECSWGSHQRGHTQFYVSSGMGIWGGKFRIGTQSEYIVATLR